MEMIWYAIGCFSLPEWYAWEMTISWFFFKVRIFSWKSKYCSWISTDSTQKYCQRSYKNVLLFSTYGIGTSKNNTKTVVCTIVGFQMFQHLTASWRVLTHLESQKIFIIIHECLNRIHLYSRFRIKFAESVVSVLFAPQSAPPNAQQSHTPAPVWETRPERRSNISAGTVTGAE